MDNSMKIAQTSVDTRAPMLRCNPDGRPDRGIGGCQTHNGRTPGAGAERSPLVYARVRAASYEGILVAANRKEKAGISQGRRR